MEIELVLDWLRHEENINGLDDALQQQCGWGNASREYTAEESILDIGENLLCC